MHDFTAWGFWLNSLSAQSCILTKFRLLENRITYCKIVRKTSFRLEQPLSNSTDCRTPITFLGENARFYSLRFLVKQPFCTKLNFDIILSNLRYILTIHKYKNEAKTLSNSSDCNTTISFFGGKCTIWLNSLLHKAAFWQNFVYRK